jgi:predicted DCC family thiol-disulfide oxidoreductase YuxK
MVFVHESIAYQGSDAALMLVSTLSSPLRHLTVLRIVPRFVRDPIYRWVARNRYLWFGQKESCMLALPEYSERFLSDR